MKVRYYKKLNESQESHTTVDFTGKNMTYLDVVKFVEHDLGNWNPLSLKELTKIEIVNE